MISDSECLPGSRILRCNRRGPNSLCRTKTCSRKTYRRRRPVTRYQCARSRLQRNAREFSSRFRRCGIHWCNGAQWGSILLRNTDDWLNTHANTVGTEYMPVWFQKMVWAMKLENSFKVFTITTVPDTRWHLYSTCVFTLIAFAAVHACLIVFSEVDFIRKYIHPYAHNVHR